MPNIFNTIKTGSVQSPMSVTDSNTEGSGAAYPSRLSKSVAHLLLAADGMEQTDDWEEKDGGGKLLGKVKREREAS